MLYYNDFTVTHNDKGIERYVRLIAERWFRTVTIQLFHHCVKLSDNSSIVLPPPRYGKS